MARNRSRSSTAKQKKSQSEINRIKPVGVLSLDVLKAKAQQVHTINVQLPDGEVYEFYHLPVTVEQSEEFFSVISTVSSSDDRLVTLRKLLADVLCNPDGSEFCTTDDLLQIDFHVRDALIDAIFASARSEGGED